MVYIESFYTSVRSRLLARDRDRAEGGGKDEYCNSALLVWSMWLYQGGTGLSIGDDEPSRV